MELLKTKTIVSFKKILDLTVILYSCIQLCGHYVAQKSSLKGAESWLNGLKNLALIFKLNFVDGNPCQSSPSLTILDPSWFNYYLFSYLAKVLFSGFLQFKSPFVNAQNSSDP